MPGFDEPCITCTVMPASVAVDALTSVYVTVRVSPDWNPTTPVCVGILDTPILIYLIDFGQKTSRKINYGKMLGGVPF